MGMLKSKTLCPKSVTVFPEYESTTMHTDVVVTNEEHGRVPQTKRFHRLVSVTEVT
jgi:hypothetical protein